MDAPCPGRDCTMDEPCPGPGSRYLTDPYIAECLTMEHVQTLLRPLCLDASSSLPRRMRVSCANFVRRLTVFERELRNQAEAIAAERGAELQASTRPGDTPPPLPPRNAAMTSALSTRGLPQVHFRHSSAPSSLGSRHRAAPPGVASGRSPATDRSRYRPPRHPQRGPPGAACRATAPGPGARRGPPSPSTPYKACTAHARCWRTRSFCCLVRPGRHKARKIKAHKVDRSPVIRSCGIQGV
jgi:hypothetical protein